MIYCVDTAVRTREDAAVEIIVGIMPQKLVALLVNADVHLQVSHLLIDCLRLQAEL